MGMAPGLPRTPFNSPALVRLLAQWAAADAPAAAGGSDSRGGLAERLGQWLDWTDAIALSSALNQPGVVSTTGPGPAVAVLAQALARVQADQARLIGSDPVYLPGSTGDAAVDVAPYRRACQARQRAMAAAITPLRARLRTALAAASPALARLAALDATLEAALGERERHLLGGVVRRIEQQFQRAQQAAAPLWLAHFHQDMQRALLAELDLRLQPAQGLLDALTHAPGQPA